MKELREKAHYEGTGSDSLKQTGPGGAQQRKQLERFQLALIERLGGGKEAWEMLLCLDASAFEKCEKLLLEGDMDIEEAIEEVLGKLE